MPMRVPFRILIATCVLFAGTQAAAARQDEVVIEPLLAIELPTEAIPAGPVSIQLAYWTWEPGATASIPDGAWQQGIVIDHILSGVYTATSGEAVLVARGTTPTTTEEVAPDTEFVVAAGEGAAYLQNAAGWEFRNSGSTPGASVSGGIFSTAPPEVSTPTSEIGIGYELLASTELDSWDTGGEESVRFSYWQATLAPGAEISAPAEGAVQLVAAQPDAPSSTKLTVSPVGAARNDGAVPVSVYGLTLAP